MTIGSRLRLCAAFVIILSGCSSEGAQTADREYQAAILQNDLNTYRSCRAGALLSRGATTAAACDPAFQKLQAQLARTLGDQAEAKRTATAIALKMDKAAFAAAALYAANTQGR